MLNVTSIIGNVGKVENLQYTPSGIAVLKFGVAVNKTYKVNGEKREETTWFRVTVWRDYAETMSRYVKSGDKIYVAGEVKASAYIDKNGKPQASLELSSNQIELLGGKNSNNAGDEDGSVAAQDENDVPF